MFSLNQDLCWESVFLFSQDYMLSGGGMEGSYTQILVNLFVSIFLNYPALHSCCHVISNIGLALVQILWPILHSVHETS